MDAKHETVKSDLLGGCKGIVKRLQNAEPRCKKRGDD